MIRRTLLQLLIAFAIFCGLASCESSTNRVVISSPGGVNIVTVDDFGKGEFFYWISRKGKFIISPSKLGISLKNAPALYSKFKITDTRFATIDTTWTQPWGEVKQIRDHYTECVLSLAKVDNEMVAMDLIFRVYDDGVAFRYHVKNLNGAKDVIIEDELTEFNLAEDAQSWWIKAYQPNRYEYLYHSTPVSEIDTVHTPLTMRYEDGTHVSIHEAALVDYSSMQIAGRKSTSLHCDLAPWSNGDKVRTQVPFKTPWRTIKIADDAAGLAQSYLNLNCNEPSKLKDSSWIKPSKYIGIWWGMIIGKWTWAEGSRHGATTARARQYIDFAATHGFDEVLIEGTSANFEGLFPGDTVTTSFTKTTEDFDLEMVQQYALSKGVSLQAYHETSGSTRNYLVQIDSAFARMQQLGISKAKIGHVGARLDKSEFHYGQHGVEYYRRVLEKAAQYRICVNFHEPIKDTGERRTYPNMLTREGAKGMEYNAWGNGGNPPAHATTLAFTRLLEAPMDFTPGIFDLLYSKLDPDTIGFPVEITLVDLGNGFSNVMYKGSESYWQSKKMQRTTQVVGTDTTYVWKITERLKPGIWEWGIRAHDIATDNNNLWLLGLLDLPNREITVGTDGTVSGDITFTIPNQGLEPDKKIFASQEDLEAIDMNVFGKTQRVNTTLAKQLAYYVVIYSPMQMAADFIENYESQPAFQFIKEVPVDWDTTIVLNGMIGEYITVARKDRNSKDWYLGSITNDEARSFDIDLSFLSERENYVAEYYRDGKEADLRNNPLEISIGLQPVDETYKINLAKGGGHAVVFRYVGEAEN